MAPGWSHYNDDYNDEDEVLDISERNEAALRPDEDDQEWWRAKLHDLGQEDDVDGTLRSSHLDDDDFGGSLPRRWQDVTPASSSSRRTLDQMGDEEYIEYLREGMESRRRHHLGGSTAPPRPSRREEERKRADAIRAKEKAQRHKAKAEKRKRKAEYEAYDGLLEERKAWLKRWADAKTSSGSKSTRYFSDVAWPVRTPAPGQPLRLDKQAIAEFLIPSNEPAPPGHAEWAAHRQRKRDKRSKQPPAEDDAHSTSKSKDLLRTALLVFHPDRFFSSPLYASLSEQGGQKEKVHECVIRVAQVLSELVEERRTKGQKGK